MEPESVRMTHARCLLLLASVAVASAQGVDSVLLLNQTQIFQVNTDPRGDLLVARQVDSSPTSPIAVFRYGATTQAFIAAGETLPVTGYPVVLASDSQGAIYLGAASTLLRPTDRSPG